MSKSRRGSILLPCFNLREEGAALHNHTHLARRRNNPIIASHAVKKGQRNSVRIGKHYKP